MKTAISIPQDIFNEADRLARRLGKSRSQLYAEAVREYLARHNPDAITAALDRVYAEIDTEIDPGVAGAAARILERTEWK